MFPGLCSFKEPPARKKAIPKAENGFSKTIANVYSFENICETLQLHPVYIRQGLLVWKKAKAQVEFC